MWGKVKRLISICLTVALAFSMLFSLGTVKAMAQTSKEGTNSNLKQQLKQQALNKIIQNFSAQKIKNKLKGEGYFNDNPSYKSDTDIVRVIVEMETEPYSVVNPIQPKVQNLPMINKGINDIKAANKSVMQKASALKGAKIRNTYGYLFNGFSMNIMRGEIDALKSLPGVKNVYEAKAYKPDMYFAKNLTQAYSVWQNEKYKGEGMVVAIVDSGIDASHKDMRLTDPSKAKIQEIKASPLFSIKVPYGHNFADENDDVIDKNSQTGMHGMHVAGIVAANGTDEEAEGLKAIKGVAPEAQLLAMKVFSNDSNNPYAYTDDLVAAIEDSVLHQADVINMSLGSTAGFQDPNDPEQIAIQRATDAGVMVVVSAGNSYYSTYPYKFNGVVDTAVVGSPGTAKDALTVASFENTNITGIGLEYTSDAGNSSTPIVYTTSEIDPVGVLNDPNGYEVVDCGYGSADECNAANVAGKIALIQRGNNLYFYEKKLKAQAAGAVGVILYDNKNEGLVNTSPWPGVNIPAVFITMNDGLNLKSLISNNLRVKFLGNVGQIANPSANSMSDFTSYGPSAGLEFKPEITAPGGNIYSTVNHDKYELMSGTSMAAPHTSGSEALILEALKDKFTSLTGRERVEFAKAVTVNTALPKMDISHPTVPYSPRRQGAGIVQIENAILDNVIVVDDSNNAAVSLKEIGSTKTYTLHLKNYGSTDVTYNLSTIGGALTEYQPSVYTSSFPYEKAISGSSITFSKDSVTVPANGEATVDVTITLPDDFASNQFVEGYVKFTPNDNSPALVSPFIGFYGNWTGNNAPAMIDAPIWDYNTWFGSTALYDMNYTDMPLGYVGQDAYGYDIFDANAIAISPNSGEFTNVFPTLYLFRNAKDIKERVLDSQGNEIRMLADYKNVRKGVFNSDSGAPTLYGAVWDGKVYNPASGNYDVVPDGQYYISIDSTADLNGGTAEPQQLIMPVKVDSLAPAIQILSQDKTDTNLYTLQFTVNDSLSGVCPVVNPVIYLNDSEADVSDLSVDENGVWSCTLNLENGFNKIDIYAFDNALNIGEASMTVRVAPLSEPFSITFNNLYAGMTVSSSETVDNVYTVTGYVNYSGLKVKLNDVDVIFSDDYNFSAQVTLVPGQINKVKVYVEDSNGEVLANYSIPVMYYDTQVPVIELSSPKIADDGKIYTNQDQITLTGAINDYNPFRFYINGNEVLNNDVGGPAEFSYTVNVTDNCFIELKVIDETPDANSTAQKIQVRVDKQAPVITINGVEDGGVYGNSVTPQITVDEGVFSALLNGEGYTSGTAISEDGLYTLTVNAQDNAGNESEKTINFTIDSTLPGIEFAGAEDGEYYNQDVNVVISVDKGTITHIYLDDVEKDINPSEPQIEENTDEDLSEPLASMEDESVSLQSESENIEKDITETTTAAISVSDEGTHTLRVVAEYLGKETEKSISFTIDKTPPVITIEKPENGKSYIGSITPVVKTDEECQIIMTLDNKVYEGKAISLLGNHVLIITATDKAGNTDTKTVNFKLISGGGGIVLPPSDTTPPTVVTSSGNIKAGESFVIRFSEQVQKSDKFDLIKVTDQLGNTVNVTASLSGDTLTLRPSKNLEYGTIYKVLIPQYAVADLFGNKLVQDISITFITEKQQKIQPNRISGNDRYETCAKTVEMGWTKSDYAVLVTGENYPDALSAAPLAKKYNAPILITQSKSLTPIIETEIARLKVKNIFIVGGEGAVSKEIENLLASKYGIKCVRISGKDRYETSAAVASYLSAENNVVIASGEGFADSLSIASYAAAKGMPILLVPNDNIPDSVAKYIKDNNVSFAYVVGGNSAISGNVEKKLPNATRLSGRDRYETNSNIIKGLADTFSFDMVYIATGEDFADALSGSVLAANTSSPIILISENMSNSEIDSVKAILAKAKYVYVLGGEGSIAAGIIDKLLN